MLQWEVKWALGSITVNKASGGDGIPAEQFQILKDDAVKVLHPICQQIWKTQQWPQDWKRSVLIPVSKKGNAKECSNYRTIALISHTSKVMLKILQARLQQCMNWELLDVQAWICKRQRNQRSNCQHLLDHRKSKRIPEKHLLPLHWLRLFSQRKPLTVWITANCGKFLNRSEYHTTLPASWETGMQVKKQPLELDMERQTGFKLGKEYIKAVYCHPAYLTYIQSTSCEMLGWVNHRLESRLLGEISTTSAMQIIKKMKIMASVTTTV